MTTTTPRHVGVAGTPSPWSRAVDRALDASAAVAVLGEDVVQVARAAVDTAAQQAGSRSVVIIDLFDGSGLIGGAPDEVAEGIYDVVEFGLSLARVARPLAHSPHLQLVQPGSCSPLDPSVLGNPRWTTLARKARSDGTLLVIAAPAGAPELALLLDQLDGVVIVGDIPAPPSRTPLLFRLRGREQREPDPRTAVEPAPAPQVPSPWRPPVRRAHETHETAARAARAAPRSRAVRRASIALAVIAAASFGSWRYRNDWLPLLRETRRAPEQAATSATTQRVAPGEVVTPGAATWSVELEHVNSAAGAMLFIRQAVQLLPAPTYEAAADGTAGAGWYRVIAGAFESRASAESLLVALRGRGMLLPDAGQVVQVPFAWLLDDDLTPVVAVERVAAWRQEGIPAYALEQPGGAMRVYVGAFETEDAARRFAPALDSLDIHATLVTRVGSNR